MNILRWTPWPLGLRAPRRELERMRAHMEGLFEALSEGVETVRRGGAGVYPAFNLSEDGENFYLTAELPGLAPSEIELSIQGDSLSLRGERKLPETDKKVNYHRREREAGFFRRVITLPSRIDGSKVEASSKNGILTVTVPKAVEAKLRQVSIKTA